MTSHGLLKGGIFAIILLLIIIYTHSYTGGKKIKLEIRDGVGPMVKLKFGEKTIDALLDTGSIYLMSSVTDSTNEKCIPNTESQVYHYAGPSAEFKWSCATPVITDGKNDCPLGDVPVGYVSIPDSQKAMGLPAVIGLCALPKWASQRFGEESLVNYIEKDEFWFFLQKSTKYFLLDSYTPKTIPKCKVEIDPRISLPTPGLGYLTTSILGLDVTFKTGNLVGTSYSIQRTKADAEIPQTSSFLYTVNGETSSLKLVEWFCLFDTGTYPAVFFADATANLLGSKVTESIISGQMDSSDYAQADVKFTFEGNQILSCENVSLPTVLPHQFSEMTRLMTVCGYLSHDNSNVVYRSENGLPSTVEFY